MSLKYPHVVAFRCTEDEKKLIDDVVNSYPGMSQGTALREFFTNGEVIDVIRRRSTAYRTRRALEARAALAAVAGDDGEPAPIPSDPLPPPPQPEPLARPASS